MRFTVIGTVMRDEIHTASGETVESFGGILYNVVALAALTRGTDKIVPVCRIGEKHLAFVTQRYFGLSGHVPATCVHTSPGGTDENVIRYGGKGDRQECMTLNTEPLTAKILEPVRDCESILLNPVSGREISLELLREFREAARGHIHLDMHNLGKEIDSSGYLAPAKLPNWKEWFSLVDTVQANEWEVEAILGARPESQDEFRDAAIELLSVEGLRAAIVTGGERGATIAHRLTGDREIHTLHVPALPLDQVVDTTGCGDCFAAGFVVGMQRYRNPLRATLMATVLSGLNATGGGPDDIAAKTRRIEAEIRLHYRDLDSRIGSGWPGEPATGKNRAAG